MKIKTQRTVTTVVDEEVEISLPAFFLHCNYYYKVITEDRVIEIRPCTGSHNYFYVHDIENFLSSNKIKSVIAEGEQITEDAFIKELISVQRAVNEIATEHIKKLENNLQTI